jgi:hypothetical protein
MTRAESGTGLGPVPLSGSNRRTLELPKDPGQMTALPRSKRRNALLLLLVPLLAGGGSALAQGDGPPGSFGEHPHHGGGGACRPDVERLCSGVERGGGRIIACLRAHEADLAPPCRDALQNAREGRGDGATPH